MTTSTKGISFQVLLAPPDVTAPPTPTGLAATLNAQNQPVLTWKASQDPLVWGATWTGTGSYAIRRDGVLLTTVPSSAPGTAFSLVAAQIGTPATPGSAVIAPSVNGGLSIAVNAFCAPWYNNSDQVMTALAPVTGDFFCCAKVTAFTASFAFSKFGITARASMDPGSATLSALYFTPAQGFGVKLEYRTIQGGAMQDGPTVAAAGVPRWIGLSRVGDFWTCYHSVDGLAWQPFATLTLALGATVFAGIGVDTENGTALTSVTVDGFNLCQLPDLTFTDTTASGGAHSYTVAARDLA
jgi:hypothetical protein